VSLIACPSFAEQVLQVIVKLQGAFPFPGTFFGHSRPRNCLIQVSFASLSLIPFTVPSFRGLIDLTVILPRPPLFGCPRRFGAKMAHMSTAATSGKTAAPQQQGGVSVVFLGAPPAASFFSRSSLPRVLCRSSPRWGWLKRRPARLDARTLLRGLIGIAVAIGLSLFLFFFAAGTKIVSSRPKSCRGRASARPFFVEQEDQIFAAELSSFRVSKHPMSETKTKPATPPPGVKKNSPPSPAIPIDRLYNRRESLPVGTPEAALSYPGEISFSHPAASIPPCTAAASGPCASTPGFGPPPSNPISGTATLLSQGPSRSFFRRFRSAPRKSAWTPTIHFSPSAKSAKFGVAIDSLEDMETLFSTASPSKKVSHLHDHQRHCRHLPALSLLRSRRETPRGAQPAKTFPARCKNDVPQGIHRPRAPTSTARAAPAMRIVTPTFSPGAATQSFPSGTTISISGYHNPRGPVPPPFQEVRLHALPTASPYGPGQRSTPGAPCR